MMHTSKCLFDFIWYLLFLSVLPRMSSMMHMTWTSTTAQIFAEKSVARRRTVPVRLTRSLPILQTLTGVYMATRGRQSPISNQCRFQPPAPPWIRVLHSNVFWKTSELLLTWYYVLSFLKLYNDRKYSERHFKWKVIVGFFKSSL